MAPYKFRLRFELLRRDRFSCPASEVELFASRSGQIVRLRSAVRDTPIQDHSRAALVSGPFDSEGDAREAAEDSRQALLLWAVRHRFGVDTGDAKVRSFLTEAGKAYWGQQLGKPVRNDLQGIDVYPDDGDVVFLNVSAELAVRKDVQTFANELREISERRWKLSEKQTLAAELYCASFFDGVPRSRFITLITAVEALLEPGRRGAAVQAFLDGATRSARELDAEPATKEALASGLERLRQDSIGQAGRRMGDELLGIRLYGGMAPGRFFTKCYAIRSQTVHRGAPEDGDVDFLDLSNKCQEFVGDLLMASFERTAAV